MYIANETDGAVEVAVVLQGNLSIPVVVRVYTADGTANSKTPPYLTSVVWWSSTSY